MKSPKIQGIYFLIDGDEVAYIGKSLDVLARIHAHELSGKIRFDCAVYMPVSGPYSCLGEIEGEMIRAFTPTRNVAGLKYRLAINVAPVLARDKRRYFEPGAPKEELEPFARPSYIDGAVSHGAEATLGYRLRLLRTSRGMTQRQLGIKSGLADMHISKMERTFQKTAKPKTLAALAEALDISIIELVPEAD